jgi:6-phosphogluconolactonase (cycloisomerase 2 family)
MLARNQRVTGSAFIFLALCAQSAWAGTAVRQQPRNSTQTCVGNRGSGNAHGNVINPGATCSSGTIARFSYTANTDGTISIYAVDESTGQLHPAGVFDTGVIGGSVTVDPTDRFAYVTQPNSSSVGAYRIDPASGALASVPGKNPQGTGGRVPVNAATDSSGHFLYVVNQLSNDISPFSIDASTGALTPVKGGIINSGGQSPAAIRVHPRLPVVYVMNQGSSTVVTYAMNTTNGLLTQTAVTSLGTQTLPFDMEIDPPGQFLYVANGDTLNVSAFRIGANGALKEVPGSPFGGPAFPVVLSIDPQSRFLFVGCTPEGGGDSPPSSIFVYTINGASGALTPVPNSPFAASESLGDITVDPSGRFLFESHNEGLAQGSETGVSTFEINSTTGALSRVGLTVRGGPAVSIATAKGVQPLTFEPKFVYVGDEIAGIVSAFRVDVRSGALTAIGTTSVSNVVSVSVDPHGRFLYAATGSATGGPGQVLGFNINSSTGALTPSFTQQLQGDAIAVGASGTFAYLTNRSTNTVTRFVVSPVDGTLSAPVVTDGAGDPNALALDPQGLTAFATNGSTSRLAAYDIVHVPLVDQEQLGQLLPFLDHGNPYLTGANPGAVAVDPTGHFVYVVDSSSDRVSGFAIDPSDRALTPVPGSPYLSTGFTPAGVATEPSGRFVYIANQGSASIDAYTIDAHTGALTLVPGSPFVAGLLPTAAGTDPSGNFLYVANSSSRDVSVYTINKTTGALTPVPGSPFATGGLGLPCIAIVGATE